jgi:hypothetical protein
MANQGTHGPEWQRLPPIMCRAEARGRSGRRHGSGGGARGRAHVPERRDAAEYEAWPKCLYSGAGRLYLLFGPMLHPPAGGGTTTYHDATTHDPQRAVQQRLERYVLMNAISERRRVRHMAQQAVPHTDSQAEALHEKMITFL